MKDIIIVYSYHNKASDIVTVVGIMTIFPGAEISCHNDEYLVIRALASSYDEADSIIAGYTEHGIWPDAAGW